jgi:hypothetical protein
MLYCRRHYMQHWYLKYLNYLEYMAHVKDISKKGCLCMFAVVCFVHGSIAARTSTKKVRDNAKLARSIRIHLWVIYIESLRFIEEDPDLHRSYQHTVAKVSTHPFALSAKSLRCTLRPCTLYKVNTTVR